MAQFELEVQRIVSLQKDADSMPDRFTDTAKVTRSIIPAANIPARLEVPVIWQGSASQRNDAPSIDLIPVRKRGRPVGRKDTEPRKRRGTEVQNPLIIDIVTSSHEILSDYEYVPKSTMKLSTNALETLLMSENKEMLMQCMSKYVLLDRSSTLAMVLLSTPSLKKLLKATIFSRTRLLTFNDEMISQNGKIQCKLNQT